jgi:hypothetical protein
MKSSSSVGNLLAIDQWRRRRRAKKEATKRESL